MSEDKFEIRNDNNVWALRAYYDGSYADGSCNKWIAEQIQDGCGRFGWSRYCGDLRKDDWEGREHDDWKRGHRLLEIKNDDWLIFLHQPERGSCLAGRAINQDDGEDPYFWRADSYRNDIDYNHCIKLDKDTVFEFEMNDAEVQSALRATFRNQGVLWRPNPTAQNQFRSLLLAQVNNKLGNYIFDFPQLNPDNISPLI